MKDFNIQVIGTRNRQTICDLKLKKSLQLTQQDLVRIQNTVKFLPSKLTPIIGQITGIPIKRPSMIVKQMLLGRQALQVLSVMKKKQQSQEVQNQEVFHIKTEMKQQQCQLNKKKLIMSKLLQQKQFKEMIPRQIKNNSTPTGFKSIDIQTNIQQQLIKSQKSLGNKRISSRSKLLPKLQNEYKYLTERAVRPILSGIDQNLKGVKSLHFYIYQHTQKIPIIALRSKTKIQVASLTKIMTFYTIYKIAQQFGKDITKYQIKIQQQMTQISGTTASIQHDQIYTIQQLLYGMMLPSGNDASIALAVWGERIIMPNSENAYKFQKFVQRMNSYAKQIKMINSTFGNPHGLPHRNNRTTCEDIAILCSKCLQIDIFKRIVGTALYKTRIKHNKSQRTIPIQWQNTNKLLRRPGFIGIKTGITVTAGPCLASAFSFLDKIYIVVIAKCNKPSRRFKQTRKLLGHCLQRLDHGRPLTQQQNKPIKRLLKNNSQIDSDYSEQEVQFNFSSFSQHQIKKRTRILTQI